MKAINFLLIVIWATIITSCMKEKSNTTKCGLILNKTATGINVLYKDESISFYTVDTATVKINKQYCR